jgi:hypothetical protein
VGGGDEPGQRGAERRIEWERVAKEGGREGVERGDAPPGERQGARIAPGEGDDEERAAVGERVAGVDQATSGPTIPREVSSEGRDSSRKRRRKSAATSAAKRRGRRPRP